MGVNKNDLDSLMKSDGLDSLMKSDDLDSLMKPEVQPTDSVPPPEEHLINPPDVSNLLRHLPEDSTDIIIGVPSSKPTSVAGKFLRLIGAEQGFNQMLVSDAFNELGEAAEEMERGGSFGGMMFASQMRETQGQMLVGGTLLSVADFEERPRKAFFNILALHAQRKMDKVRFPGKEFDALTFQDYGDAVADGWDARQRMGSVKSLSALLNPGSEVAWEEFLKRHPDFAKVANTSDAVSDFGIAVLAEIAIGKGLGVLGKFAIKIPKARFTDSLDDIMERTIKNAIESEGGGGLFDAAFRRLGEASPDVDIEEFARFVTELPGAARSIPLGATTPDDFIKSMFYKRFIGDSVLTKENPSGWIKQKDLDGIVNSATFRDRTLRVVDGEAVPIKVDVGRLTFEELQDIAIELDSIKAMPTNFKKGVFATANRFSIAPPVRIFDTLGLGRQYARVADGVYNVKALRNQKIKWYADSMREYRKRFTKTWTSGDNKINQAWGRIMDNTPLEEWPDEILDAVSTEEIQWLTELAQDNRTVFYDPLRDEAIRQGRITSDPDLIAAGVPPVVDNYYHRIRLNVVRGLEDRRALAKAAGDDIKPLGFNAKDILKKDIKTEFKHGEFLARKAAEGDINYNGIDVDMRATQEIGRMLNIEPELKRMDAAIEALPVDLHGKQKAKAKGHFKSWVDQIRHVPAEIDLKLDSIFNAASNNIEKVVPRWEASERAFQNFAITSNRAVDRGLLKFKARPTIRNLFQTQHNLHIYGPKSSLWGAEAIFTSGGQKLLRTSQAMVHRGVPIAAMDITNQKRWASKLSKIDQATTYAGIAITDKYINVSNSILSGWHSYFSKNKRAFEELAIHAKDMGVSRQALKKERFADVVAGAVSQGKFTDARRAIDFKGVALTQWLYDSEMMTPLMRSFAARSGLKYTTWQQNFWGGHMPQLIDQLFKGKDIFGMKPTLAQRTAIFQVIGKVGLAVYLAKEHGIDMTQVTLTGSVPAGRINIEGVPREIPLPVSPVTRGTVGALQLAIGSPKASTQVLEAIGQMRWGVLTEDNQIFEDGWKNFVNTMAAHVPASGAALQVQRVIEGDLPPEGILWPMPRKSKPATSRLGVSKTSLGVGGKELGISN